MATSDYTPIANLTPEFLGADATDQDLRDYRLAVESAMTSREFDRDEEGAAEFVWNNGSIRSEAGACAYCERVVADVTVIPASDDDEGWAALAPQHDDDCEWIVTRAHRLV